MITFLCDNCGEELEVPDDMVGQRETCPGCKAKVLVPANADVRGDIAREVAQDSSPAVGAAVQRPPLAVKLPGEGDGPQYSFLRAIGSVSFSVGLLAVIISVLALLLMVVSSNPGSRFKEDDVVAAFAGIGAGLVSMLQGSVIVLLVDMARNSWHTKQLLRIIASRP